MITFLVDSGRPLPHKVQFAISGKCLYVPVFHQKHNIPVASFSTRSLSQITTSTTLSSIASKRPPRKRQSTEEEYPSQQIEDEGALQSEPLTSQPVGETTLLIRKNKKPDDSILSAPLVLKRIAGGVRKSAGCRGDIMSFVGGFNSEDDEQFCFEPFRGIQLLEQEQQLLQVICLKAALPC